MADEKTIIMPDNQNSGWGNVPLAMTLPLWGGYGYNNGFNNGGFLSGNGFGAFLGGLIGGALPGLFGWGGNGFWGNNGNGAAAASLGAQATAIGNTETILRAIDGTDADVRLVATTLNSDVNTVKTNLATLQNGLTALTGQTGLSAAQIINAIQAGDADLASRLCQCCCEMRQLTVEQGYQNQIRTLEQTSALAGQADRNTAAITSAIAAQTTMINEKFCDLEKRELQGKIDALTASNTLLRTQIDNANQTAAIGAMIAPIAAEVNDIKCKLPNTVPVTYPNISAVNNTPYAGNFYGAGFGWGGFGGNIVF